MRNIIIYITIKYFILIQVCSFFTSGTRGSFMQKDSGSQFPGLILPLADSCSVFILRTGNLQLINLSGSLEKALYSSHADYFVMNYESNDNLIQLSRNFRYNTSDFHRHRKRCIRVFSFLLLNEVTEAQKIGEQVYSQIIRWEHVIRKDEDFFYFIVPGIKPKDKNTLMNDILIGSKISGAIKHKALLLVESTNEYFQVSTSCPYCNGGNPGLIHLPELNTLNAIENLQHIFNQFKLNFHGKVIQVSSPTGTGWIHELSLENNKWKSKRGLYKTVLDNLMLKHNFSCNFFPSKGGGGTGSFANGSWVGSVGDIVDGTADLGQTTGQTWQRNKVAGFTFPISYETLAFTSGLPLPFYSWKAMFWPLSSDTWIGICVSFVIANLVMAAVIRFSERSGKMSATSSTLAYTVGSLLEQDVPSAQRVKSHSIRLLMSFWLIFSLITTTAYRSKLVSSIAFPLVEEPPTTFEELANSDYTFALQYLRGAAYALLKSSPNPTYKRIYKRMELEEEDTKCFQRAIGKRFVCISWQKIADYVYRKNLTDRYGRVPLLRSADTTCFLSVAYIMEKRAIFQSSFNALIIHATDTGMLNRWTDMDLELVHEQRLQWEKSSNVTGNDYSTEVVLSLSNKHFKGSYFILAGGSIISLIVMVAEGLLGSTKRSS